MKKVVLLIPMILLLTSCGVFKIGFVNEQHSAGIEGQSTSNQAYTESYTYFSGDPITTEGKSSANITFEVDDGLSNISKEKVDEIIRCDVDNFFASTVETFNVGTRENSWLFVGAKTSYADGYLTLGFNQPIKDVQIEATPYYYEDNSWNELQLKIDEGVCVAVNESNYIKLSSLTNTEGDTVNSTECRYHFASEQTQIKIKVGGEKAFIKKITLYY